MLEIQRQSGANTVDVIEAVKKRLDRCREVLPQDVTLQVLRDQSRYIHAALDEIQKHLIVGSILASAVVLLFMRSWRSTLIAAIAIPTSLVSTFAMMRVMNFTLEQRDHAGTVLMVGVVIDDAIVVLENIFRWIEEEGVPPMQAAIVGTQEIGLAVLAITLSLVIVFLPSFVHFQRYRPHAVRVRLDRLGGDPRVDGGQFLADADDVLPTAQAGARRGWRRRLAPRLLPLDRARLRCVPPHVAPLPLAGAGACRWP